jgi:hypothetical protein
MQDVVVSAVSNYEYDKLKVWVNSLNSCGFKGRKIMICFNVSDETVRQLNQNGVEVFLVSDKRNAKDDGFLYQENFSFQVPTVRHIVNWMFLKPLTDVRYVISTDCADVVFQSNPSEWLEKNLGDKKLNYGCEGLKYKNEDWGYQNILNAFGPLIQNHMQDIPIYNAGSMAGEHKTFVDFSLAVFLSVQNLREPMPDQAGVNLLLSLEPYKSITKFNDHDTNWACQCGTTVDPIKIDNFRPNLLSPEPVFDFENGVALNSKGEKYVLLHQYNRVPSWKTIIEKKYG